MAWRGIPCSGMVVVYRVVPWMQLGVACRTVQWHGSGLMQRGIVSVCRLSWLAVLWSGVRLCLAQQPASFSTAIQSAF